MEGIIMLLQITMVFALICVYFAPAINAYWDKKINKNAILALNLLLGWTLLGWVIALVWSLTKDKNAQ